MPKPGPTAATIHNVPNEAAYEHIETLAKQAKCTTTCHKHSTQCKLKGTASQIDAFAVAYRS